MPRTTNLDLYLPTRNDTVNVLRDLDDNFQKIDDGTANIQNGIAYYLKDTNTTGSTLAIGTYVYVTGNTNGVADGMYKVSTAIAANGSLTASNLTAVSGGIGNELNSKFLYSTGNLTKSSSKITNVEVANYGKYGRIVFVYAVFTVGSDITNNTETLFTGLPDAQYYMRFCFPMTNDQNDRHITISIDGTSIKNAYTSDKISPGQYTFGFSYLAKS